MRMTVELRRPNYGVRPHGWKPKNSKVHRAGPSGPRCATDGTVTVTTDDDEVTCCVCLYHMGRYTPLSMRPVRC